MKLLVYSGERTGSYSLCKWLSKELNLKFLIEIDEWQSDMDDIVVKRTVSYRNDKIYFDINADSQYFDKIIILYRNDTQKQAESNIFAEYRQQWHHSNEENGLDGYYEITPKFLRENEKPILRMKSQLDSDKKYLLSLDIGFRISYEELYSSENGQMLLEQYLNIKGDTKLFNPKLKLRKGDFLDKNQINKYIL